MSEEEIKAIETLKEVASDDFDTLGDEISPKMAQNILNVLEKQDNKIKIFIEKEVLEEYRQRIKEKQKASKLMQDIYKVFDTSKYISKDKIREKIKEIHNKGTFDAEIVLTKLLEEEDGDHIPRID